MICIYDDGHAEQESESKRVGLCVFEIMSFITLFSLSFFVSKCWCFFSPVAGGKIGHLKWITSKVAKAFCILNAFFIHRHYFAAVFSRTVAAIVVANFTIFQNRCNEMRPNFSSSNAIPCWPKIVHSTRELVHICWKLLFYSLLLFFSLRFSSAMNCWHFVLRPIM